MTEQHYRVVADRDKGDDPQWGQVQDQDRVTSVFTRNTGQTGHGFHEVVRIERPVPTTDEPGTSIEDDIRNIREAVASIESWPLHSTGTANLTNDEAASLERVFTAALHPSLPTREQITEAIREVRQSMERDQLACLSTDEAFHRLEAALLALLNGADRG